MGETEEKENGPTAADPQEAEEPKETDQMLKKEEKPDESLAKTDEKQDETKKSKENIAESADPKTGAAEPKSNGEEIVNIPEDDSKDEDKGKIRPVSPEGREVKPKKIPIGGLKLPGFFTRSKKPEASDGAEGELLEKAEKPAEKPAEENAANESRISANFLNYFRFRNPFAKKETAEKTDEKDENAVAEDQEKPKENDETPTEEAKTAEAEPAPEQAPKAEKKSFLKGVKLPPLGHLIPKRLRPSTGPSDDLEMGNGPNNKAGLASMETLDDSQKDNDSKDQTDKANGKLAEDDLETVKLDEKEEKPTDKAEEAAADQKKLPILERIRGYQCSIDDIAIVAGIAVFILLVAIICIFTFTGKSELKSAPIKEGRFVDAVTSCGFVEGMYEDSAFAFRGIPYAVPPLNENRWRPAKVIDNIDYCWNGTFLAHNSTPVCWQTYANGSVEGIEDCLTLDVITPHVRYDNPLPVVVLIGGESLMGDSPGKLRPSKRYARARDVVFVRPNFRLGAFGFLALDELSQSVHPPRSGNFGLSDIIAALHWIQLNIAHFGGDAKSVTLFGHRIGATLVTALTTSPLAKDLFARAWVTSGTAIFPGKPLSDYEKANRDFMSQIKCETVDCLRKADEMQILDAVPDIWRRSSPDLPAVDENTTARHEWLILDGEILQKHPADVWNKEIGPPKLVIGSTAHESHSEKLFLKHKEWTPELVRQHIQESKIGQLNLTDEALKRYNATYQGLVSMISDIRTICPLLTIARQQPSAPFYVVTQTGGNLTIADADSDILAILGRYEPKTPEERRYVSAIQQLFYHYVSHGDMKQYDPRQRVIDIGQDALSIDDYPNCGFWIQNDVVPRYAKLE